MVKNKDLSVFEKNIEKGVSKGILKHIGDKIAYLGIGKDKKDKEYPLKNPEEKVRASFFTELVLDYGYPKELINLEVVTPNRVPKFHTDIVVFEDKENKQPLIAIEIKKEGISQAVEDQAVEQVFSYGGVLRAKFCLLVAGTTRIAFDLRKHKAFDRQKNKISDIPKFNNKEPPKYIYFKGKQEFKLGEKKVEYEALQKLNKEDLISVLGKCHDTIWQGGKLAPTQAFDEVSKLLFCKIKDEKDTLNGKNYNFQIGSGESIEEVSGRVKKIYEGAKREDGEVFGDDIGLEDNIIYNIVEKIQGINFVDTDLDTKGVAFERFMEDFFKGRMGQYFTPREIINFCVKMMDVNIKDKVLDTCCGSGGFLLACLNEIREWAEESFDENEAYRKWHDFAEKNLFGIEVNEQIARVCKMNMIIHDDGHTNIISADGLDDFKFYKDSNKMFQKEKFDKILTNPPFGAVMKSNEKVEGYLDKFDLGKGRKNQKTEILFIERCLEFLKENGKMAIVLPDGILTNSTLQYVRDFLMEHSQILAIVSLPQFAFSHFGAGVKSSLVFVRKKEKSEDLGKYPIFMADAKRIGYDSTGRKDEKNDLIDISEKFKEFVKG